MSRKLLLTLLKVAFAVALIVYVIDKAGWEEIRGSLASMDGGRWAFGLALVLAANVLAILRWHLLMVSVKLNSTPWVALRLGFIGVFFNNVMPGSSGGDLVKAFYVTRENPQQRASAVVSVIVDRVIGIIALALIAAVVIPFDAQRYGEAAVGIYGFLAASGAGMGVVLSRRAKRRLRDVRDALRANPGLVAGVVVAVAVVATAVVWHQRGPTPAAVVAGALLVLALASRWALPRLTRPRGDDGSSLLGRIDQAVSMYRDRLGTVWVAMAMSFAVHLLIIWSMFVFGHALVAGGLESLPAADVEGRLAELQAFDAVPFSAYCSLIPVIMIVKSLPISPNGWGVGEWATLYFFAQLGVAEHDATALSLVYSVTAMLVSLLGGVFLALDRKRVLEAAHVEPTAPAGG